MAGRALWPATGVIESAVGIMVSRPCRQRGLAAVRTLHAETAVLVAAKEFPARDKAFAARQVNAAYGAANHVLAGGRAVLRGGRRRRLLLSFDTAKPSEQEVDNDDQRYQKQEFGQEAFRGVLGRTIIAHVGPSSHPDAATASAQEGFQPFAHRHDRDS